MTQTRKKFTFRYEISAKRVTDMIFKEYNHQIANNFCLVCLDKNIDAVINNDSIYFMTKFRNSSRLMDRSI